MAPIAPGPIGRRLVGGGERSPTAGQIVAEQLRDALAELRPSLHKASPISLRSRPDLLPPAFEAALSTLPDFPAGARRFYSEAVGTWSAPSSARAPKRCSPVLVAGRCGGSIGQVHPARLQDGRQVVVKVRRPGVEPLIELDLTILRRLTRLASVFPRPGQQFKVAGFVEEFGNTTRAELDYLAEGHNADRARPQLARLGVHVPEVVWASTTSGFSRWRGMFGAKIDDLGAIDAMGIDRSRLARTLAQSYLSMVFVDGFFHADPHPGNFFVEADGRLAMVDFGMTGTVAPQVRRALVEILLALSTRASTGRYSHYAN